MKTIDEYIQFIRTTRVLEPGSEEDNIERLLALPNEVGELLGVYKKHLRDGILDHREIIDELGDVLYSICAVIDMTGYSGEYIIKENIKKLTERGRVK